jgi:chromosome partitioning protein
VGGTGGTAAVLHGERAADSIVPSSWTDLVDVLPSTPALQRFERGKPKRLRKALSGAVTDRYTAVLVDCPPSNADLMVNALTAARHAIVVVEPSTLGLRGLGSLADTVDRVWDDHNPDLELAGVVVNRVPGVSAEADRRIEELGLIVGASAIWTPFIAQRVVLNEAVGDRRPIHSYGARATDSIKAFDALWHRITALLAT